MSGASDDRIERLLRENFDGPVPAGDFCDRVMRQLPLRRRSVWWPLAAGALAGVVACWFTLSRAAPFLRTGWHDWFSGQISAPALALLIALTSASLLALAWAAAEADDRGYRAPDHGSARHGPLLQPVRWRKSQPRLNFPLDES
jgi:hypothetical protein